MAVVTGAKNKISVRIGRGAALAILIFLSVLVLIPLVWTICMSVKPDGEIYNGMFFPTEIHPENYYLAVTKVDFFRYLLNTLIIVVPSVIGMVFSCALVAYGFSRFDFKGKRVWFLILLATMMIPGQVTMIPQFLIYRMVGWVNTYLPLVVPTFFAISGYNVFLMRSFMSGIPKDFDEAATIGPLIYLYDANKFTLSLGLSFFKGLYTSQWNLLMAATVLVMLPILVLFFMAQDLIINGISISSGTKG